MIKGGTDTADLLNKLYENRKKIEAQQKKNDRKLAKIDRKFKQLIERLGGF